MNGGLAAILLAAGQSCRFGPDDKLMAQYLGAPLVSHAAKALASLSPDWKIAVCSRQDGDVAHTLVRLGFEIVINESPESGLSRSLAAGVAHASKVGASAALIALGDMPNVGSQHLRSLLSHFDEALRPIVASAANGIPSPPAIFAQTQFDALCALEGDHGARTLLRAAQLVPADPEILVDIDTFQDLDPSAGHP